ncbi:RNase adapter RapZ, partial [Streptomyces edwardsiae]
MTEPTRRAADRAGDGGERPGDQQDERTDRADGAADVSTNTTNETGEAVVPAIPELVIISGMSGAGRSTAAKCLEDLGWFVVDNLPPALIPTMVELGARSQGNVARIAVVVDVRGRRFFDNLREG